MARLTFSSSLPAKCVRIADQPIQDNVALAVDKCLKVLVSDWLVGAKANFTWANDPRPDNLRRFEVRNVFVGPYYTDSIEKVAASGWSCSAVSPYSREQDSFLKAFSFRSEVRGKEVIYTRISQADI